MRAAVLRERHKVVVEDVSVDEPAAQEVLIRTVAAGVCHSDVGYVDGSFATAVPPLVLGHESAGIVEQVGSAVAYVEPGDHVVTYNPVFCGHCEFCLTGRATLCSRVGVVLRSPDGPPRLSAADGQPLGQMVGLGSFGEQLLVHENAVVKIDRDMPLDKAALLGCGVSTGLGAVLNKANVRPGATVAVIGCGGVGLSVIQGARISGAVKIIAVDRHATRLELARELGATHSIDAAAGDAVEQARELTGGGVDHSFEVAGRIDTIEQAFAMLKPGGTTTVVGVVFGKTIPISTDLLRAERRLQGSLMGSGPFRVAIPHYVELYLRGQLKLDALVTATFPIERVNDALTATQNEQGARSIIRFE